MTDPEAVLKAQRSLSILSGTKKISVGLMGLILATSIAELIFDADARTHLLRSLSSCLGVLAIAAFIYSACVIKIRDINAVLGDT